MCHTTRELANDFQFLALPQRLFSFHPLHDFFNDAILQPRIKVAKSIARCGRPALGLEQLLFVAPTVGGIEDGDADEAQAARIVASLGSIAEDWQRLLRARD